MTSLKEILFVGSGLEFMDFPSFSFPGKREIFGLISREPGNSREMRLLSTCIKKSMKNRDFRDYPIQNQKILELALN